MTFDDFRVLSSCPTEIEVITDFVKRLQHVHTQIQLTDEFGPSWVIAVCDQHALESLN